MSAFEEAPRTFEEIAADAASLIEDAEAHAQGPFSDTGTESRAILFTVQRLARQVGELAQRLNEDTQDLRNRLRRARDLRVGDSIVTPGGRFAATVTKVWGANEVGEITVEYRVITPSGDRKGRYTYSHHESVPEPTE